MLFITEKNRAAALPQKGQCGCTNRRLTALDQKDGEIFRRNSVLPIGADDQLRTIYRNRCGTFDNDGPKSHNQLLFMFAKVCRFSFLTAW